jgi:hypothetical protein
MSFLFVGVKVTSGRRKVEHVFSIHITTMPGNLKGA